MSCVDGCSINPFKILCDFLEIDVVLEEKIYVTLKNKEVVDYLCKLSCGVKSQIWGEDQIISQVKNALSVARENNATDGIIEVLFRISISSAKKIKTNIKIKNTESSIAFKVLDVIKNEKAIKKILVIGNGEAGRLIASILGKNNYDVTITLRHYHNVKNIIPTGCKSCDYTERYNYLEKCDAVISATLSPHLTIEINEILKLVSYPKLYIDVAVPRDIDTEIKNLKGVSYFNIDNIYKDEMQENRESQLELIQVVIEKYIEDFYRWCRFREKIDINTNIIKSSIM